MGAPALCSQVSLHLLTHNIWHTAWSRFVSSAASSARWLKAGAVAAVVTFYPSSVFLHSRCSINMIWGVGINKVVRYLLRIMEWLRHDWDWGQLLPSPIPVPHRQSQEGLPLLSRGYLLYPLKSAVDTGMFSSHCPLLRQKHSDCPRMFSPCVG